MEACYINTAHPDFMSGHKAIAIVNDKLHPKPQPGSAAEKQLSNGPVKQASSPLQTNGQDTPTDSNGSFFGSFFSGPKKPKKSAGALMEAVICLYKCIACLVYQPFFFSLATNYIEGNRSSFRT